MLRRAGFAGEPPQLHRDRQPPACRRRRLLDRRPLTYDTTIACVNADEFPVLNEQMRGRMPVAASTVGIWAWEVEVFPQWMARSAALGRRGLGLQPRTPPTRSQAACAVPVHVFAPPVIVPERVGEVDRAAVGLTDDFTFLFCFDFAQRLRAQEPAGASFTRSGGRSRPATDRAS